MRKRETAPPAPVKVDSYHPERLAICTKAKKIRYGRERLPGWAYYYDDGNITVVLIEEGDAQ